MSLDSFSICPSRVTTHSRLWPGCFSNVKKAGRNRPVIILPFGVEGPAGFPVSGSSKIGKAVTNPISNDHGRGILWSGSFSNVFYAGRSRTVIILPFGVEGPAGSAVSGSFKLGEAVTIPISNDQ